MTEDSKQAFGILCLCALVFIVWSIIQYPTMPTETLSTGLSFVTTQASKITSSPSFNPLDYILGGITGICMSGIVALVHFLWIKKYPMTLSPKVHRTAGGEWTSNYNLMLKNRSPKICHAIWLTVTTDNPQYDFLGLDIQEAAEKPPYNQMFLLKNILVTADFTQILRCDEDNKTQRTMHIAMLLPGDQRLYKIQASNTIKNQKFFFRISSWSSKPVQILTKNGTTAIQFSIPSNICGEGKTAKLLAQGIVAKRQT